VIAKYSGLSLECMRAASTFVEQHPGTAVGELAEKLSDATGRRTDDCVQSVMRLIKYGALRVTAKLRGVSDSI
jgi:hypothetical protein